jgi:chromatin remodeling complex protein RSC6
MEGGQGMNNTEQKIIEIVRRNECFTQEFFGIDKEGTAKGVSSTYKYNSKIVEELLTLIQESKREAVEDFWKYINKEEVNVSKFTLEVYLKENL